MEFHSLNFRSWISYSISCSRNLHDSSLYLILSRVTMIIIIKFDLGINLGCIPSRANKTHTWQPRIQQRLFSNETQTVGILFTCQKLSNSVSNENNKRDNTSSSSFSLRKRNVSWLCSSLCGCASWINALFADEHASASLTSSFLCFQKKMMKKRYEKIRCQPRHARPQLLLPARREIT